MLLNKGTYGCSCEDSREGLRRALSEVAEEQFVFYLISQGTARNVFHTPKKQLQPQFCKPFSVFFLSIFHSLSKVEQNRSI